MIFSQENRPQGGLEGLNNWPQPRMNRGHYYILNFPSPNSRHLFRDQNFKMNDPAGVLGTRVCYFSRGVYVFACV